MRIFEAGNDVEATSKCRPRPQANPAEHAPKVSLADARAKALAVVAGSVRAEELEHEGGRWIYSFEIKPHGETRNIIREVNIDADTGAVVNGETEKD